LATDAGDIGGGVRRLNRAKSVIDRDLPAYADRIGLRAANLDGLIVADIDVVIAGLESLTGVKA
jgi:hypothetical protein